MIASDSMSLSAMIIVTVWLMVLGAFALSSSLLFKAHRRDRKRLPGGLHVRHDPKDAKFEIVAVHGLGANPEYTWTCKAESPGSGGNSRVHLLDLLAKQFPNARITNFAHSSDWLLDASFSTVQETGMTLSRHLVSHREKTASRLSIIFIGHSFGGIVVKEALDWLANNDRWDSNEKWYAKNIVESTRGILFLGTPHRGSPLALWASLFARATRILGSEIGLLYLLSQDSGPLSDIADRFEKTQNRLNQAAIFSFYEQRKTYLGFLPIAKIVGKESARGLSGKLIPINTDHSGLNKCRVSTDQVFQEINTAIETATSLPPSLSRADRWILDRYANDDRLRIQRISGERLSMDSCYVNLNIVEQDVRDGQHVDHVQPPSLDLSLAERLERSEFEETWKLNDGEKIHLPDLFNPRKFSNEKEERRPRRILIRGRAGVGKSTLCKKIIGDFLQLQRTKNSTKDDSVDLGEAREHSYCSHFARIIWVPLGNLATRQDRDFWEWLLGMYFAPMENPEAEPMAKALKVHLQNCNSEDDTLFLLDGMDEIASRLQDESTLKESVDWLIGQRNVIVTSRPSVRFDRSQKRETFDMELETIGFYQTQVEDYVAKVEQPFAANILAFLNTRPLIQDLVRIPVQLDALCFAWKDAASRNVTRGFALETMTGLYQAIEGALWRKDSYRLNRTSETNTLLSWEVEKKMKSEIALLENLAFEGLCEGLTVFDEGFLKRVFKKLPEELQPQEGLDSTLQRLSFLRSPEVSPDQARRNYYFLHLTHQEYFAARHLKRQWIERNATGVDAIDFFQVHKYSERFDIVWRFLSGLLASHDDEGYSHSRFKIKYKSGLEGQKLNQLEQYFAEIRQEPLDMLGPAHQRLVMRCLREVPTSQHLSERDTLEKQLEYWLLSESRLVGPYEGLRQDRSLADEAECPESLIEKVLPNVDDTCKIRLLRSLEHRRIMNERTMGLVMTCIRNGNQNLIETSLAILGDCPEPWITEDGVQLIIEKLGNISSGIVSNATKAIENLMKFPELSKFAVRAILQGLNSSPSNRFQINAIEIIIKDVLRIYDTQRADHRGPTEWILESGFERFGVVSCTCEKSPGLHAHLTDPVMQLLESSNQEVREHAEHFLKHQTALPETVAMKLTRELMNSSVTVQEYMEKGQKDQRFAFAILKNKKHLQEAVLQELVRLVRNGAKSAKNYARTILENQLDLPRTILDSLAQSFEDGDRDSRKAIGAIFSNRSNLSSTVFQCLLDNLQHTDTSTQLAALKTLPLFQNPPKEVLAQLCGMLADPDSQIFKAALGVLREKRDLPKFVLDQISAMLGNEDENIRKRALEFFKRQGTSHLSSGQIETMLKSQDRDFREFGLGLIRFPRDDQHISLCQIDRLADDEDESVRNLALISLARSSDKSKWFDRIEKMISDGNPDIRRHALKISEHKELPPLVLDLIAQMIDDGCDESIGSILGYNSGRLPAPALRTIVGKLKDKNPRTRIAAFEVVERLSPLPPAVLQRVVEILEDGDSADRVAALNCLRSASPLPPAVLQLVVENLEDGDSAVRVAALDCLRSASSLPPAVLQLVVENLEDGDSAVRVAALDRLRRVSPLPQVVGNIIEQRLQDPDADVRSAARRLFNERRESLQGNPVLLMKILQGGHDAAQRGALRSYLRHFNPQESLPPSILQMLKSMVGGAQICAQSLRLGDFYGSHSRHSGPKLPVQIVPNTGLLELIAQSLGGKDSETAKFLLQSVHQGIQLPDTVSSILLQKLNDDVAEVQISALKIIEAIGDWPEEKIDIVTGGLVHAKLRHNILKILSSQSHLSTRALSNIAALFKEPSVSGRSPDSYSSSLLSVVLEHPGLATICASQGVFVGFYRFLLQQSFDGHLVWLHQSHGLRLDRSSGQSQRCFQTTGEEVGNELVKARRSILGPKLALESDSQHVAHHVPIDLDQ